MSRKTLHDSQPLHCFRKHWNFSLVRKTRPVWILEQSENEFPMFLRISVFFGFSLWQYFRCFPVPASFSYQSDENRFYHVSYCWEGSRWLPQHKVATEVRKCLFVCFCSLKLLSVRTKRGIGGYKISVTPKLLNFLGCTMSYFVSYWHFLTLKWPKINRFFICSFC